jgi:SAM-dependent methyltransferase
MMREFCGGCRSTDLRPVLDLGLQPNAGYFPKTFDEPEVTYPLGLVRCGRCTLIQLPYLVPDDVLWQGDYGFYTGASWPAALYQYGYARGLINRYELLGKQLTVEIACNDGTMLKHFADAGFPSLGVDPAVGPTTKAKEAGLDVLVDQFGFRVAEQIVQERGQAGLVVANNVIAHVADLDDFVSGLEYLLAPLGVAVIEFQYVGDLILGNQIDQVYHEHRQFFSLKSLSWVLGRHGLMVFDVNQVSPQGGSLRVHITHKRDLEHSVRHLKQAEAWLDSEHALDGLQGRANRIRSRLRDILWELKLSKKRVAGYGASAKAMTLINFCDIGPDLVQYFVDTTITKQGRYTPGAHIPIISPSSDSRRPDAYLLGVWNYLPEVLRSERTFEGNWVVPIPVPTIL